MIDEVIQNKQIQDTLPDNNPLKLEYKKTDEALIIADQLYKQYNLSHIDFDMHSGKQGNYLILCGIHFNIPILKVGETTYNPSERLDSHISKYRISKILISSLLENHFISEKQLIPERLNVVS